MFNELVLAHAEDGWSHVVTALATALIMFVILSFRRDRKERQHSEPIAIERRPSSALDHDDITPARPYEEANALGSGLPDRW